MGNTNDMDLIAVDLREGLHTRYCFTSSGVSKLKKKSLASTVL